MPIDGDRVTKCSEALTKVREEVDLCHQEQQRVIREFHAQRAKSGAMGAWRDAVPGVPDCTIPEQELRKAQEDFARAQQGKPPLPPFLGGPGRDLLTSLEDQESTAKAIPPLLAVAASISPFDTWGVPVQTLATGGHDLHDTATAMDAIPAVVRADIRRQVGEHLASQTQMGNRERKYWELMYEKLR
jgi:hypothetical protein